MGKEFGNGVGLGDGGDVGASVGAGDGGVDGVGVGANVGIDEIDGRGVGADVGWCETVGSGVGADVGGGVGRLVGSAETVAVFDQLSGHVLLCVSQELAQDYSWLDEHQLSESDEDFAPETK